jgi:hypothetical protein
MRWSFDSSSSGKLVLTGGLGLYGIMVACNATFLCIVGLLFIPFLCIGLLIILFAFCACSSARRAMRKSYITLDSQSGYMSIISQGAPEVRVPLSEVDCADIINRSHTVGSSKHHTRRTVIVTVLVIKKMDGSHLRTNIVDAGNGNDEEARDRINAFLRNMRETSTSQQQSGYLMPGQSQQAPAYAQPMQAQQAPQAMSQQQPTADLSYAPVNM